VVQVDGFRISANFCVTKVRDVATRSCCPLQARAIAAAPITCLQAANEEWVRLGGQADLLDLYDAAVQAIRRPT
jgi:hypothetical protein